MVDRLLRTACLLLAPRPAVRRHIVRRIAVHDLAARRTGRAPGRVGPRSPRAGVRVAAARLVLGPAGRARHALRLSRRTRRAFDHHRAARAPRAGRSPAALIGAGTGPRVRALAARAAGFGQRLHRTRRTRRRLARARAGLDRLTPLARFGTRLLRGLRSAVALAARARARAYRARRTGVGRLTARAPARPLPAARGRRASALAGLHSAVPARPLLVLLLSAATLRIRSGTSCRHAGSTRCARVSTRSARSILAGAASAATRTGCSCSPCRTARVTRSAGSRFLTGRSTCSCARRIAAARCSAGASARHRHARIGISGVDRGITRGARVWRFGVSFLVHATRHIRRFANEVGGTDQSLGAVSIVTTKHVVGQIGLTSRSYEQQQDGASNLEGRRDVSTHARGRYPTSIARAIPQANPRVATMT